MTIRWLSRGLLTLPYITLCLTPQDFAKVVKKLRVADSGPWVMPGMKAAVHHVGGNGNSIAIVCLDDWRRRPITEVFPLLVHESVHIWQEWKRSHSEESPGDEVEAYAIQEIAQKLIIEFMDRKKSA